jgi:pyroglutamyl-peptidase
MMRAMPAARTAPLLVTGFEPFGGDRINPSGEVAQALHARTIEGVPVIGLVLPCVFGAAIGVLRSALDTQRPQLVLALGLAAGREGFTPERVAINLDDARIPDNAGAQPIDRPVVARGAPAHFSTLPIKAMVAALRAAGHPASVSNSAGTFVCNHVFYGLMHALRRRRRVRGGFMHLPCLPEQAARHSGAPSLPLATMIDGVALALAVAMRTRDDSTHSEGRLD